MMHYNVANKRILEVGCGLGLSSLVLNSRGADITATDIHPEARANLRLNTDLNEGKPIPYFDADWRDTCGQAPFDLVIASDVLYQRDHPQLLAGFIDRHSLTTSQIVVVDPARGNLSNFGNALSGYGFRQFNKQIGSEIMRAKSFKGQVRTFQRA